MVTGAERALGTFISAHPTDNGRRGRVAVTVLLIGLALTAAAVPVTVTVFSDGEDAATLAGLLWGGALIGLYGGMSNGLRTLQRHGETFVLREDGLAYRRTGETRVLPWSEIRSVAERGQDNALGRLMGWDTRTVIRPRTGRRLLLTGYTEDAAALSARIRAAAAAGGAS
ncbi:hypothetical protein GTW43_02265 [Streptomyces sp. SID5785]|uniref:PH domain-containing protein n=1 Tax=Streptomyces sp. SID5785 TaxID=2690309 RepID=UPI001360DA95|nr:PH domain-containing protein [Streptomyces sp. SID5785]MZD03909.1 hypothetical protein [Streptomyces sp. SID5785]